MFYLETFYSRKIQTALNFARSRRPVNFQTFEDPDLQSIVSELELLELLHRPYYELQLLLFDLLADFRVSNYDFQVIVETDFDTLDKAIKWP